MTGPATGGTERGTGAPSRSTGTQGAVGAVLLVLALGLALRLIIAHLLPGSGFEVDLERLPLLGGQPRPEGLTASTSATSSTTTRPGYLYVLWLRRAGRAGVAGRRRRPDQGRRRSWPTSPSAGWSGRWSASSAAASGWPSAAAIVAVVNPITWFDSVVWGQVDSFGVVFLLLGLRELWRDRPERAAIYTVIAAHHQAAARASSSRSWPWSRSGGRCGPWPDDDDG